MFETMKKYAVCALATLAFCLVAAPGIAWAGVAPAIVFGDVEEGALPVSVNAAADAEGVRAFKLTLAVEGAEEAGASVGFEYDGSLGADVREVRSSTIDGVRRVSLYVASKNEDLLTGAEQALGKLTVASKDGASVSVSVAGFEAVNAAHGELGDLGLAIPEGTQVQAKAENGSTNPPDDEGGDDGKDDGDQKDDESGDGDHQKGDGSDGGDQKGDQPDGDDRKDGGSDVDPDGKPEEGANVSPGAPSGTDATLVATGDGLLPLVAAFVAIALAAALVAFAGMLRSRKPGGKGRS